MVEWNKIKTEYINGYISQQKLAEKHGIPYQTLRDRANKEKWRAKRDEQRKKIGKKTEEKTAEKIATAEANRMERINAAADKLLEKIELATEQLDLYLTKDKRKYTQPVKDKNTGKTVYVDVEEEKVKFEKASRIDRAGLKQIASALKDLKDIQLVKDDDKPQETPNINITISAATPNDAEGEEE